MHDGIRKLQVTVNSYDLGMTEASLRWIYHHSALGREDSVILGGSGLSHVKKNLAALKDGPLDDKLVEVFDDVWEMVKEDALQ